MSFLALEDRSTWTPGLFNIPVQETEKFELYCLGILFFFFFYILKISVVNKLGRALFKLQMDFLYVILIIQKLYKEDTVLQCPSYTHD